MQPESITCDEAAHLLAAFAHAASAYARLLENVASRFKSMQLSDYAPARSALEEARVMATAARDALQQHYKMQGCSGH